MVTELWRHHLSDRLPFFRSQHQFSVSTEHWDARLKTNKLHDGLGLYYMSTHWIHVVGNIRKTWDVYDPQSRWTWGHFQQDGQGYNRPPLASPLSPLIQSFAVDYTASLSAYPFNPAMQGTQQGDTSNVPQLFFMRRKLSGPKAKGTRLWKDKRDVRSVAMRLACGGKWCNFSVHGQRSFFFGLPQKNPTYFTTLKCNLCGYSVWKQADLLRSKCANRCTLQYLIIV